MGDKTSDVSSNKVTFKENEEKQNDEESKHKSSEANEEEFDILFDKILATMGEFGTYQKFIFFATIPFVAGMVATYLGQLFIIVTPKEYWCKIPQLETVLDPNVRHNLSTPKVDGKWKNCYTYDVDWAETIENMNVADDTPHIKCSYDFEYNHDEIPYTNVVTERNWVCEKAYYVPLTQTFFFLGAIIGGFAIGKFADSYGRIPALIVANVIGLIGNILTIFTGGLWDFIACRVIAGISFDNSFYVMYILLLEFVGPNYRTLAGNLTFALFMGGSCLLLPVAALYCNDWKLFTVVTSLPMLAFLAVPFVIPESVRWLAAKGKIDEAIHVFKRFELVNKKRIPPNLLETFKSSAGTLRKQESYTVLVKSRPLTLALILITIVYSCTTIVYDCIMRLSGGFDDNFFIAFSLYSLTEIPSNLIIAFYLDRFGRRPFTYVTMIIAAITAIIGAFLPVGILVVCALIISRGFMIIAFNTSTQWVLEILPTTVRGSGSSFVHISGYVASIIAPFIAFLSGWHGLPLLILAAISILGAVLSYFLPETKGMLFPQSIHEGEKLVLENSVLYKKTR